MDQTDGRIENELISQCQAHLSSTKGSHTALAKRDHKQAVVSPIFCILLLNIDGKDPHQHQHQHQLHDRNNTPPQ
ncbi:unnamed protein product [Zymoseptoria tritici ST99CH_3D7]|uniref:Uncharacterized protein n=1 Tax=Zymoseptoria tritici (strain ST99CH_3D7) TaxID=1276538 RepID=A0A1X7RHU1_ZYMT9|nr:unnamed protein product [Zymoseptoria tritici ST99CH_3D7]